MNPKSRVSAHYVVARDGNIVQMVHEHEKAWHAGVASINGDPYVNSQSVGIELVNWGELKKRGDKYYCWPDNYQREYDCKEFGEPLAFDKFIDGELITTYWAPYTEAQVDAVIELCREIVQRHPDITPERILGHEDVASGRKNDPGPALDMEKIRRESFVLPNELYLDSNETDKIVEEEMAARQADRAEPLGWIQRLLTFLQQMRGNDAT